MEKPQIQLKRLLDERGITQDAFARMLDVHPSKVSRYVHNPEHPSITFLVEMCEALGVTLDEMYGRHAEVDDSR